MISLVVALVVLGLVLWLVSQIPMDPTILRVIQVVCIIIAVLYVLRAFGLWAGGPALP